MVLHHKFECPVKNWIAVFRVKVTVKVWNDNKCLFGQCLLNLSTVSCRKKCFTVFKVKVAAKDCIYLYDCFYYIFWTADPFTVKLSLMVHSHMLLYRVKKIDHFVPRLQWNFRMLINVCPDSICWITEPFITRLGIVMHHHELEWKDWFAFFKVKVTVEASNGQIMTFCCVIWTADPIITKLGVMA